MALIVFHVQDQHGRAVGGARLDAKCQTQGDWSAAANACGDCFTELGEGHYDITVTAPGCGTTLLPADLKDPGIVTIQLTRQVTPAAGLAVRGAFFETTAGEPHTVIECTDFRAFARYLEGADIVSVLSERVSLGFNTARVFLMCHNLFPLNPLEVSGYFDRLAAFTSLVLDEIGLTPEYVAFADATLIMPSTSTQRLFWASLVNRLDEFGPRVLLELVNENDVAVNTINTGAFPMPATGIGAHGSNGSERWPVSPVWGYETFHTNDAYEWWRKAGHNAMEIADTHHVPVVTNENTRFPDRDASPTHAFDAAAGAALLCAGSCFHSVSGRDSVHFTEEEAPLAEQWALGAQSVDLKYQKGAYRHCIELETPDLLRVYSRVLPGGDEGIVKIRK